MAHGNRRTMGLLALRMILHLLSLAAITTMLAYDLKLVSAGGNTTWNQISSVLEIRAIPATPRGVANFVETLKTFKNNGTTEVAKILGNKVDSAFAGIKIDDKSEIQRAIKDSKEYKEALKNITVALGSVPQTSSSVILRGMDGIVESSVSAFIVKANGILKDINTGISNVKSNSNITDTIDEVFKAMKLDEIEKAIKVQNLTFVLNLTHICVVALTQVNHMATPYSDINCGYVIKYNSSGEQLADSIEKIIDDYASNITGGLAANVTNYKQVAGEYAKKYLVYALYLMLAMIALMLIFHFASFMLSFISIFMGALNISKYIHFAALLSTSLYTIFILSIYLGTTYFTKKTFYEYENHVIVSTSFGNSIAFIVAILILMSFVNNPSPLGRKISRRNRVSSML